MVEFTENKFRQVAGVTGPVQSHETVSMDVVPAGEVSFETLRLPVTAFPISLVVDRVIGTTTFLSGQAFIPR